MTDTSKVIGAYDVPADQFNLDPLTDLNAKQLQVYLSDATEILYGGAAGAGKSFMLRYMAIISCLTIAGLQVYLFRRLSGDLTKNHMDGAKCLPEMLGPLVMAGQVTINYSNGEIRFHNGSKIHLCHCQYEKDRFKYQGAEIHVLLIDELTHFTEGIYTFLRTRVRLGSLSIPEEYRHIFPRIICGSNPGGIGHNFVKAKFIDPAPERATWKVPATDGGMLRQYIPARLEDNSHMMAVDPDYADRIRGEKDPAMVDALLNGNWDIVSGGAIDDVWDKKTHVITPFKIPSSWYIDRTFDWGSAKPYATLWFAQSNGEEVILEDGTTKSFTPGTLFVIKELYGCMPGQPNTGTKELAVEVADKIKEIDEQIATKKPHGLHPDMPYRRIRVRPGAADSSIWNDENGMSIERDMRKRGVKWIKANKKPGSRIQGLELIRARLKASLQGKEEPGLYIFNHCVHLVRTLPVLPRSEYNSDDVDTNSEDHLYDGLRYRCLARKGGCTIQEI